MQVDPSELMRLNRAVPRYTSYPTAPEWLPLDEGSYRTHLRTLGESKRPVSLYLHIPFCHSMCLYCACSVVLNRRPEREEEYVEALCRESSLVAEQLGTRSLVKQLHFGGGTPTQLTVPLLDKIMRALSSHFEIDSAGEISIEIDPRTVAMDRGEKLRALKALGFNRVSFGVQDTNEKVQEAVKRRQSWEVTESTYLMARELGYREINIDLIYGLPYQTQQTFAQTVEQILSLRPNRIALFSYAKVPWLKPHQKAIADDSLPSTEEKFRIYAQARHRFQQAGYVAIGMDHFAEADDSLAVALSSRTLQRNFQGYSLKLTEDLIGLGVTATGLVANAYAQNVKELDNYYSKLRDGHIPVFRGKVLTRDDLIRKWTIHRLMCDFSLHKADFEMQWGVKFDSYFAAELTSLDNLVQEGLLAHTENDLQPTFYGSLFIRNIAAVFDSYLKRQGAEARFSKAV